jgi:hypothetical protein
MDNFGLYLVEPKYVMILFGVIFIFLIYAMARIEQIHSYIQKQEQREEIKKSILEAKHISQ